MAEKLTWHLQRVPHVNPHFRDALGGEKNHDTAAAGAPTHTVGFYS